MAAAEIVPLAVNDGRRDGKKNLVSNLATHASNDKNDERRNVPVYDFWHILDFCNVLLVVVVVVGPFLRVG